VIVVLTDQRRSEHLAATLIDVDSSAIDQNRVVLVDGTEPPPVRPGWRVVCAPKPAHAPATENRWTTWRAFELACEAQEDLLFIEDDVKGCPGAAKYAGEFTVPPDCAFVMFYAPWGDATMPWCLFRIHAAQFSFCQALKVPLRTCQILCDAHAEMKTCSTPGSDECIREIGAARDWMVGVHYPGIYQHVGVQSLVSGDRNLLGNRSSRAWLTGDDAAILLRPMWRAGYR